MENIEKAFTDIADAIREKGGTSETLYPAEMPGGIRALPSGGGDVKTFVAEYGVTTAQEIIAYLDASKEPFAPMLIKRGNDYYTVTTAAKQADNKIIIRSFATLSGDFYMFTYTVTDGTWSSSSHGFQKKLESGTNIKTVNNESLLGGGNIDIPVYDDTALADRVSANETAIANRYTKDETDGKIAEAMTDVDNEHFHPVTVLPDPQDEDPKKRPRENHEYILIEYEQDGTTIKSETHYLFYGGEYHQKSNGGMSLDGYATEQYVDDATNLQNWYDKNKNKPITFNAADDILIGGSIDKSILPDPTTDNFTMWLQPDGLFILYNLEGDDRSARYMTRGITLRANGSVDEFDVGVNEWTNKPEVVIKGDYLTEFVKALGIDLKASFDVTAIPQGPTGANEINAVLSNNDNEGAIVSYVRQDDGTLPNVLRMNVRSGLGEDSFELPTKKLVDGKAELSVIPGDDKIVVSQGETSFELRVENGGLVFDINGSDTATLQSKLQSGSNIKTINGQSLLGSGDITISGGGGRIVPYIERMVNVPLFGAQGTLTAEINPKYSSYFDRSSYTHMMLANIRITHYDDQYLYGFAPNETSAMFTCKASSEVSAGMLRVGFATGSLYGTYKGWSSYLNAGLKQHLPGVFSSSVENSVFAGRILLGIETQKSGADAVEEMVWLPLFAHVSMPSGKDDMLVSSLYATYYFPTKFSNGDTINVFAERIEFMISREFIDFADGYGPYA